MRKRLLIISALAAIIFFALLVFRRHEADISINWIKNSVIREQFVSTLETYYEDNDDSFELTVYSFSTYVSPLKIIALYNMMGEKNADISNYEDEENMFRFAVEKSIYTGKNYLAENMFNQETDLSDYCFALYMAEQIGDKELKKTLKKLCDDVSFDNTSGSKELYYEIINWYTRGSADNTKEYICAEILEKVRNRDAEIMEIETLYDLKAAIHFLLVTRNEKYINSAKSIYEILIDEKNEGRILFSSDAIMEDYLTIVCFLEKYIGTGRNEDLFSDIYQRNETLYKGITYDVTSPRNFAGLITAFAYANLNASENMLANLGIIFSQLASEAVSEQDMFYLMHVAKLLNIRYSIPAKEAIDIDNDYYSLLLYSKEIDEAEFDDRGDDSDTALLMKADVCKKNRVTEEKLADINIFDYKDSDEFATVLQLYVCVLKKYDMLSEDIATEIKKHITSSECSYGYAVKGAYDFRTSVYYTNILYILDGGEDIGLC